MNYFLVLRDHPPIVIHEEDRKGYGEFELFLVAGICQPPEKHALQVRKALKVMGYDTHTVSRDGRTYILPGEARQTAREPEPKKHDDRER